MDRSTLDKLISSTGLIIGVVLLAAAGVLVYASNFIHGQVHDNLVSEKIMFPTTSDKGYTALPDTDKAAIAPYAGQQLLTGAQAQVFANHYIAVHLQNIGDGKTYSELSAESMANPSDTALAGKVATVFRGETLRGILLNAYAFDTMATVARVAALGALVSGGILIVLAFLGFGHAGKVATKPAKSTAKKRR